MILFIVLYIKIARLCSNRSHELIPHARGLDGFDFFHFRLNHGQRIGKFGF
jgi:hypothetical protein